MFQVILQNFILIKILHSNKMKLITRIYVNILSILKYLKRNLNVKFYVTVQIKLF